MDNPWNEIPQSIKELPPLPSDKISIPSKTIQSQSDCERECLDDLIGYVNKELQNGLTAIVQSPGVAFLTSYVGGIIRNEKAKANQNKMKAEVQTLKEYTTNLMKAAEQS